MVPLYLGGDHTIANLMNVQQALHDDLHTLVNTLELAPGVSLAPSTMQNMAASFSPGVALIDKSGVIEFRTLAELPAMKAVP